MSNPLNNAASRATWATTASSILMQRARASDEFAAAYAATEHDIAAFASTLGPQSVESVEKLKAVGGWAAHIRATFAKHAGGTKLPGSKIFGDIALVSVFDADDEQNIRRVGCNAANAANAAKGES